MKSNNKINSLIDVIDNTSTAIGKREFKNRILNPILDVEELNKIYNIVEELQNIYCNLEVELNMIKDIERYHRKLVLKYIKPNEFGNLNETYLSIKNLLEIIKETSIYNSDIENLIEFINNFYSDYIKIYNIDNLKNYSHYSFISNIFNEGIIEDFDNLINEITTNKNIFENLKTELISICKNNDKTFDIKFDFTNKYGYSLELTEKRSKLLKKKIV